MMDGFSDAAAPPAYGAAESKSEPPPSYDSLFGKIKNAKENSDGNVDFAKTCCGILMGSVACTICLGLFLAIPVAMIVIGAIHLHDCPKERMIPIYLIVAGSVGILSNIIMMIRGRKNSGDENSGEQKQPAGFEQLLNVFLTAWFIAGNVWVYRTYDHFQSDDASRSDYCHARVYWFTFWLITVTYILFGVCLLVCILGCICACLCGKKSS